MVNDAVPLEAHHLSPETLQSTPLDAAEQGLGRLALRPDRDAEDMDRRDRVDRDRSDRSRAERERVDRDRADRDSRADRKKEDNDCRAKEEDRAADIQKRMVMEEENSDSFSSSGGDAVEFGEQVKDKSIRIHKDPMK